MRDYLKRWTGVRHEGPALGVSSSMMIVGEQNKHLGPRFDFARVTIEVEASDEFVVINEVAESGAEIYGFPDRFVFGLLDEIMTNNPGPIEKVKVILRNAEYDPVDSSPRAFSEAGRDAGRKLRAALGY